MQINEYRLGKYTFKFVAPKKTNDAHGYYSLESIQGIPKDYIRVYFTIRQADTDKKAETYSISLSTWEAIKGKYFTILCHRVKEYYEDVQSEIMNNIEYLLKRNYRTAISTIIPIPKSEEVEEEEILTNEVNNVND